MMGPVVTKHTAKWDPPVTNADGTALNDLAGFFLYWKKANEQYSNERRKDVGNVTTFDLVNLGIPYGQYTLGVSAYDTSLNESGLSNEIPFDYNIPGSPTGLQIS
jgi:hypothetical protein